MVSLDTIDQKLDTIISLMGGQTTSSAGDNKKVVPKSIVQWDAFVRADVEPFVQLSGELEGIGDLLKSCQEPIKDAFLKCRQVLLVASLSKRPKTKELRELLNPLMQAIDKIEQIRFRSKGTASWEHLSSLNEGMKALQWVGVQDAVVNFIAETVNSAAFYTNKIMREYRTKDTKHIDWIKALTKMIKGLEQYAKDNHTTGMRWNAKDGGDAMELFSQVSAGKDPYSDDVSSSSGGLAPPSGGLAPPSGGLSGSFGPPGKVIQSTGKPKPKMSDLFAEIKKASTGSLKHVTKDMKTKYLPPEERKSVVPGTVGKKKPKKQKTQDAIQRGTPSIELIGDTNKTWKIQFYEDDEDLEIPEDQLQANHSVYVFACENCVLKIPEKVKSISLDSCEKTSVIFDSTIANCELVNCHGCKVQAKSFVPMVQVDKSSGLQIFLPPAAATSPIVTANCNEINLCVINDEDYDEIPIPESFVHKFDPKTKTLSLETNDV